MTKKIVLVAYSSDSDSDVRAVLEVRSALLHLPSDSILKRFEVFDVVDSNQ